MALPDDPHETGFYATVAGIALTGVVWIWKSWFGVKRDLRDDRKGDLINGTYEATLKMLRERNDDLERRLHERDMEIDRLRAQVRQLGG